MLPLYKAVVILRPLVRGAYCQVTFTSRSLVQSLRRINLSTTTCSKNKTVTLSDRVTVDEISRKIGVEVPAILKLLKEFGYTAANGEKTVLDFDIAEAVADEYDITVSGLGSNFLPRPPVITIMGHVDHGKTTLLDHLRRTSVAQKEAGGITQAIGAFSVQIPDREDKITFIDTPGHAAFNEMRHRGAHLTDVVVLVVAADDGVMEQTVECIQHIKSAQVPLFVAINKIDRPNANPEKVKRELLSKQIHLEDFGGNVKSVNISALKGTNMDAFLNVLNIVSKDLKLTANHDCLVEGVILEAEINKYKGAVATVLVKKGTLKIGDVLIAGSAFAKTRQLFDHNGKAMRAVYPSEPVQLVGWRVLPEPGQLLLQVKNESEARNFLRLQKVESRPAKVVHRPMVRATGKKFVPTELKGGRSKRVPLRVTLRQEAASGVKPAIERGDGRLVLNILLKVDVSGSLEAIVNKISSLRCKDLSINILGASVGNVNETDLLVASTSNGIVYGFNSEVSKAISSKAERLGVSLRNHSVIYKLFEDLKDVVESRLPLLVEEDVIGGAEVLAVFQMTGSRKGVAAGCRVNDGSLDHSNKQHKWRVVRNGETVHEGSLKSLKRGTNDISSAKKMTECGLVFTQYDQCEVGDVISCVKQERVKQSVDWKI